MKNTLTLTFHRLNRRPFSRQRDWWWTLSHPNGNIVGGSTEGYANYEDAVANANLVMGLALDTVAKHSLHVFRGLDGPREQRFNVEVDGD